MAIKHPEIKTSIIKSHLVNKEIGKLINSDANSTENSTVSAIYSSARAVRTSTICYGKAKMVAKKLKRTAYKIKAGGIANISIKNAAKQVGGSLKNISKVTLRDTGITLTEVVYSQGTNDSMVNSLGMSAKTAIITKDITKGTYNTVQKGKNIYKFVNQNLLNKKKINNNISSLTSKTSKLNGINTNNSKAEKLGVTIRSDKGSQVKGIGRAGTSKFHNVRGMKKGARSLGSMAKSNKTISSGVALVSRTISVIKLVTFSPKNLLLMCGAGAILILFIAITSSIGNSGQIPSNFLMADKEIVEKYVELIEKYDYNQELKIEAYKKDSTYDDVVIEWMNEIGAVNTNWQDIISVIAVENEQNLTFSMPEQNRIKEIYNKLNYIKTRAERYYCSGCKTSESGSTYCPGHIRLYVQVYCLDIEEIIDDLGLDEWQKDWARNLIVSDWASLYPGIGSNIIQGEMSASEIKEIMLNTPTSSATREQIRETALSLVGKVGYFWGGKSPAGWNNQWGRSTKVTAPGNSTTGTYQPYGLDCSGFTDWVYKTAGVGNILSGGGSSYQWNQSYAVTKNDLQIGDLVFKSKPGSSGVNHVGIYVGKDSSGKSLYCHCAWSQGVVVDSYKGFKYYRRPFVNFGKE